ncbi:hypothetical protein Tco_0032533, partial [Tanacetum coccineum]
ESDDLNILDVEPVDPVLEASSLPKFDMKLYKYSLTKTHVKWLAKCYGNLADLHPRVVLEGMTMNALPNDAIGLYAHHFQQGGLRFPFSSFFLKDLPPKTGDMVIAEIPYRKVLDDKEKKRRKADVNVAANVPGANIQADRVAGNKDAGKEGARKKRRILANEEYVSPNASAGRMGTLQNQTDEYATPPIVNASEFLTGGKGVQDNVDVAFANEGHGDNEGGLSGLRTQPSPVRLSGQHPETVEKPVRDKVAPDVESAQQQANTLLRFEALTEEHANLIYAYESCKDVKSCYKECKKELVDRIKQLEEALRQSEADAHQLRLDREKYVVEAGEAFSLAISKGFIDGISIGRKDPEIQAILKATPNVNPTSSDIFMETYEKLFDKRYSNVNKVARMYLLDPSSLQNVMPYATGPTPGGGPHDTSSASYAYMS